MKKISMCENFGRLYDRLGESINYNFDVEFEKNKDTYSIIPKGFSEKDKTFLLSIGEKITSWETNMLYLLNNDSTIKNKIKKEIQQEK